MEAKRRQKKREKKRWEIRKLTVLSITFFILMTVYNGVEILQQAFYPIMGTASTATVFGTTILCSIFAAVPILSFTGAKWGIFPFTVAQVLYVAANFVPTWGALIPLAVVLGVSSGVAWTAAGVYMHNIANKFSIISGRDKDRVLSLFWGMFFWYIGFARPLGYYIAKDVLYRMPNSTEEAESSTEEALMLTTVSGEFINSNTTFPPDLYDNRNTSFYEDIYSRQCGVNFCPHTMGEEINGVLELPDETFLYMVMAIYLVASLSGVVSCATLPKLAKKKEDNYPVYEDNEGNIVHHPKFNLRKVYQDLADLYKDYRLHLLILPYVASGMIRATHKWSFSRSFVVCAIGSENLGPYLGYEGLGYSFAALFSGYLVKYIPHVYHLGATAILNVLLAGTWLLWDPNPDQPWVFFILAGLQGITSGVWRVHTMSITGILFADKLAAAYAHLLFWDCLGHMLVFAYNNLFCFWVIAILFIAIVMAATVSYIILELAFIRKIPLCTRKTKKGHRKLEELEDILGYVVVDNKNKSKKNRSAQFEDTESMTEMEALLEGPTATFDVC